MPTPVFTPRINNNDDTVRLSALLRGPGDPVRQGDPIADIETDKATFTVEAPLDGYLLAILPAKGDMIDVGSTLAWIGATSDEPLPSATSQTSSAGTTFEPTIKALLLLRAYGLRASDVAASGDRLTAEDVEHHHRAARAPEPVASLPATPGHVETFTPEQRGMARTVTWHRDEAVPGYIEIHYDPEPWNTYAAAFQREHSLLINPLLPLMARRLVDLAAASPRLNSVAAPNGTYLYDEVNVGFTIQSGANLYLAVLREAQKLDAPAFVAALGQLQRSAMKHALKPEQLSGATIAFTSMARWQVSRHIPILPPQTSVIVAHTAPADGKAFLGATYDHRILTGFDIVQLLQAFAAPPSQTPPGHTEEPPQ